MRIELWLLLWVANTVFTWWVAWWGGAAWFEGWREWLVVDRLFTNPWSAEQIALYTLLCWIGHTVWFVIGLFMPEVRRFYW